MNQNRLQRRPSAPSGAGGGWSSRVLFGFDYVALTLSKALEEIALSRQAKPSSVLVVQWQSGTLDPIGLGSLLVVV